MSGTAGVANTFANAVTATGAQLDANYTTIVAYLNDPTNRNNYAADGAATNTVALTFSPAVSTGYTAGLDLCWKWGVTNTGAVVLNANGLGNINVVNPDGSALQSGQGIAGSIGRAVYDGTRAIYLAPPSPSSQAAMETATASASFVSPAALKWHPGVAKASAFISQSGGVYTVGSPSFNISSTGKGGAGTITVVFSNAFSNTAYQALAVPDGAVLNVATTTRSTASVVIVMRDGAGTGTDASFSFTAFGDLP